MIQLIFSNKLHMRMLILLCKNYLQIFSLWVFSRKKKFRDWVWHPRMLELSQQANLSSQVVKYSSIWGYQFIYSSLFGGWAGRNMEVFLLITWGVYRLKIYHAWVMSLSARYKIKLVYYGKGSNLEWNSRKNRAQGMGSLLLCMVGYNAEHMMCLCPVFGGHASTRLLIWPNSKVGL